MDTEIAIVGAGPAGLAAAAAATGAGARVTVIDENPGPGGQFLRARLPERAVATQARRQEQERLDLLAATSPDRATWLQGASVWGAFPDHRLALTGPGQPTALLSYQRLIVCTGAYERVLPFPGWTLPGVLTGGAVQTMIKAHGVLPGERIVLAGTGPFLLPVAAEIAEAGGRLVAVLEAAPQRRWTTLLAASLGDLHHLREAWNYWERLRRTGVEITFGWRVLSAEGEERLQRLFIAPIGPDGTPDSAGARQLEADALCVSDGFLPSSELTRHLGCSHQFSPVRGGWIPTLDEDLRTSIPEVLVAGEAGGVGGADVALAEGELAGLVAARDLGFDPHGRIAGCQQAVGRLRRDADRIQHAFQLPPQAIAAVQDSTVVCRCEEVTAGDIRGAASDWRASLTATKGFVRTGMGACQGRMCLANVADILSVASGVPAHAVGMASVRLPLKPVSVATLASLPVAQDP